MGRAATAIVVLAMIGAFAAHAGSDATGERVIDRTYVCSIELTGGIYELEARAHAGVRSGATWAKLPYAALRAGNFGRAPVGNMLVWVTAGVPARETTVDLEDQLPVTEAGTIGIYSKLCRRAAAPAPLQRTGLRSQAAGPLGAELACEVPRRVVVRVRAVLSTSGRLRTGGQDFHVTHSPVREAQLAVRTLSGTPLALRDGLANGQGDAVHREGLRARVRRSIALIAVGCLATMPLSTAHARQEASRVVDRTFSCATGYVGGIYQTSVESYWHVPPQGERRTPSATASTVLTNGFLGGISPTSVYVNRLHCKATKSKLPLTTKRLRGGAFSPFNTEFDCFTPRKVLLRVRGAFVKPTTLHTASPFGYPQLQAMGPAIQTELAVGTLKGKPIAYASIAGVQKARLFIATDCEED